MNAFITEFNSVAMQWFNWHVSMFWQVGILLLIVLTADTLIKNRAWPQVRYALWLMLVLKLVLPPSFALDSSLTSGIQPVIDKNVEIKSPAVINALTQPELSTNIIPEPVASSASDGPALIAPTPVATTDNSSITLPAEPKVAIIWQSWLLVVWFAGLMALAGLMIGRVRKIGGYHAGQMAIPAEISELVGQCAASLNLRRVPRVIVTDRAISPFVYGIFRPTVILPADSLTEISPADLRHHLLHELAHIKRGDLLVHGGYVVVQLLYWFNPLVWIIGRQVRHLREICCDTAVAAVLKEDTKKYRQTLLETARRLLAEPVEPTMGLLGLFEDSSKLLARLQWLEKPTWKTRKLQYATALMAGVVMICCVLPMAQGQEKTQAQAETSKPVYAGPDAEVLNYLQTLLENNGNLFTLDGELGSRQRLLNLALVQYQGKDIYNVKDLVKSIVSYETNTYWLKQTENSPISADCQKVVELIKKAGEFFEADNPDDGAKLLIEATEKYIQPLRTKIAQIKKANPSYVKEQKPTKYKGYYIILSKNLIQFDPLDQNDVEVSCRDALVNDLGYIEYKDGKPVLPYFVSKNKYYNDEKFDLEGLQEHYVENRNEDQKLISAKFIYPPDQLATISLTCEMDNKDALFKSVITHLEKAGLKQWPNSVTDGLPKPYKPQSIEVNQPMLDYLYTLEKENKLNEFTDFINSFDDNISFSWKALVAVEKKQSDILTLVNCAKVALEEMQKQFPDFEKLLPYASMIKKLESLAGSIKTEKYQEAAMELQDIMRNNIAVIQSHLTRVQASKPGLPFFPDTYLKGNYKVIGPDMLSFDTNDFPIVSHVCERAVTILSHYDSDYQQCIKSPGFSSGNNTSTGELGMFNGMKSYVAGNDKYGNKFRCEITVVSGQPIDLILDDSSGDGRLLNEILNQLGYTYLKPKKSNLEIATKTNPQTPEEKQQMSYSALMAAGNMCISISHAVERADWDAAQKVADDVVKLAEETMPKLKGEPLEPAFQLLMAQFNIIHEAIKAHDKEKVLSMLQALNAMGENLGEMLGQEKPKDTPIEQAAPSQTAIFSTMAEDWYNACVTLNELKLKQLSGLNYNKAKSSAEQFNKMCSYFGTPKWVGVSFFMWDTNNAVILSKPLTYTQENSGKYYICIEFEHDNNWYIRDFSTLAFNKSQLRLSSLLQQYGILQNIWPESYLSLLSELNTENIKTNKIILARYIQELNIYSDNFELAVNSENWQNAEFCMGEMLRKTVIAIEFADDKTLPVLKEYSKHLQTVASLLLAKNKTSIQQEISKSVNNESSSIKQMVGNDSNIKNSVENIISYNNLQWRDVSSTELINFDHGGSVKSGNVQWFALEHYGKNNLLTLITVKHPYPVDKCRILVVTTDNKKIITAEKSTTLEDNIYTQKKIIELPADQIKTLIFQAVRDQQYNGPDAETMIYLQEQHEVDQLNALDNHLSNINEPIKTAQVYLSSKNSSMAKECIEPIIYAEDTYTPSLIKRTENSPISDDCQKIVDLVRKTDKLLANNKADEAAKLLTEIRDNYIQPLRDKIAQINKTNPSHYPEIKPTEFKGYFNIVSHSLIQYDALDGEIVSKACRNAIHSLGKTFSEGVESYKDQNYDYIYSKKYIDGKDENQKLIRCEFLNIPGQTSTVSLTCELNDKDALLKAIIAELKKTTLKLWPYSISLDQSEPKPIPYMPKQIEVNQSIMDYLMQLKKDNKLSDFEHDFNLDVEQAVNRYYATASKNDPENKQKIKNGLSNLKYDIEKLSLDFPTPILLPIYDHILKNLDQAANFNEKDDCSGVLESLQEIRKLDVAVIQSHLTRIKTGKPGLPFFPETSLKGHYKFIGPEMLSFDTNDYQLLECICSKAITMVSHYDNDYQPGKIYPGFSFGNNTSTGENGIIKGMQSHVAGNDKNGDKFRCEMIVISGQPITLTLEDSSGDHRLLNELFNQLSYTYLKSMPDGTEAANVKPEPQAPEDKQRVFYNALMAAGNMFTTIGNATTMDDWATAEREADNIEKLMADTMPKIKGEPTELVLQAMMAQFNIMHEAIKARDKEKALSMYKAINAMGENLGEMLK